MKHYVLLIVIFVSFSLLAQWLNSTNLLLFLNVVSIVWFPCLVEYIWKQKRIFWAYFRLDIWSRRLCKSTLQYEYTAVWVQQIQCCFICSPADSTVSEDAEIELRTVSLAVRHLNHSARSHPQIRTIIFSSPGVRASYSQRRCRNCPRFDPSILRHSRI